MAIYYMEDLIRFYTMKDAISVSQIWLNLHMVKFQDKKKVMQKEDKLSWKLNKLLLHDRVSLVVLFKVALLVVFNG